VGRLDALFVLALLVLTIWVGLSIAWSVDRAQSVLELERGLVPLLGCAALLALAQRSALPALVCGLLLGIGGICTYSLWTRLVPTSAAFHPDDPVARYRLFEPVGYWNGLGLFAVLGIFLALALVTEPAIRIELRLLSSVSLVVLPVTLFFTFSRGAWLALVLGLGVCVASSPHRLRLAAEGAVFAIAPVVAVALAWRAGPLHEVGTPLSAATRAGERLAIELLVLALAAAAVVPLVRWLERRLRVGAPFRRILGITIVAVAACALAVGLARSGGPVSVATRAYKSFTEPVPPRQQRNLTTRLANLNGNGRARMWAVALDSLRGGRWAIGSGAGSFERNWDRSRKADEVVRDAHGLYVETVSELGVSGLVVLLAALVIPLTAGLRRRGAALVPALMAGYAAFLLHLAVDWDWELSGVALTGLFVGCLLLIARRENSVRPIDRRLRFVGASVGLAAAAFSLVGLAGNTDLARAQAANQHHRSADAAAAAADAHRLMPWSPAPLRALGTAQLQQGNEVGARASFRAAIALDPNDWQSWLDLAASVHGRARIRAVAHARMLYPRSPEVAEFQKRTRH
jgi:O-Antigen ligase